MKVCFLVNDLQLSGGVGVVVEHARQLANRGVDAQVALARDQGLPDWGHRGLDAVPVLDLAGARATTWDVAVATWWETTYAIFDVPAERHAYFVQSLEDRFYRPDQAERLAAALTHDLPLAVVTEARWIAETLDELRPGTRARLVRNGVAKDVFGPVPATPEVRTGPLRVLVEGSPDVWFKGVPEALAACSAMREQHHVTAVVPDPSRVPAEAADRVLAHVSQRELAQLYAETDVVLKLSRVEGMSGPPLEGMHRGATCVVTPVTGHEEYVEHGVNGLVVDWDDVRGTARALDLLARDRALLHLLRTNALATAASWPSWEQQGAVMAAALRAILRDPAPSAVAAGAAISADARAGVALHGAMLEDRARLRYRVAPLDRLKALPGAPAGQWAWQLARRALR